MNGWGRKCWPAGPWAPQTQILTRGRPSPLLAVTAWDQLTSMVAGKGSQVGCLYLAMSSQLPGAHPGGTRPLAALSEPPFSLSTPAFISGAHSCTSSVSFTCCATLGHPSASLRLGLPHS